MDFDTARQRMDGVGYMLPRYGRVIYEHVLSERHQDILEIGTANGVSAGYMAAALDEKGGGSITSLDSTRADYKPGPIKVLGELGLQDYVELVRRPDTSYTWWLKEKVQSQSDDHGNCEPCFDFVFIDGAHNWTVDGLATVLAEKLLRPGGWLLLDDLDWSYAAFNAKASPEMSESEMAEPHIRFVYDLIVKQHPSFSEFREQDGHWGWAKKSPGAARVLTMESTETPTAMLLRRLRFMKERIGSR